MKSVHFLPTILLALPLSAQISVPQNASIGKSVLATVSAEGAISYQWMFESSPAPTINNGQGTPQLEFTPTGIGRINLKCLVNTPTQTIQYSAVLGVPADPYAEGIRSISGPVPVLPGDEMGLVPLFYGGTGRFVITSNFGGEESYEVQPGLAYWVASPTTRGEVKTCSLVVTSANGKAAPTKPLQYLRYPESTEGNLVGPDAVTAGTTANLVRRQPWAWFTVPGYDYKWDGVQGGAFTQTSANEARYQVYAAPGSTVTVSASFTEPAIPSAGIYVPTRVSKTLKATVVPAPDATITCNAASITSSARMVTASVPASPMNFGFYPYLMHYSWSISGGVLRTNGARSAMFDVTAKPGETVTIRCTVTNDAGTSAMSEKIIVVGS